MSNMINLLAGINLGQGNFFTGISAWFVYIFYKFMGLIYRVLGLFADYMNIAFYIISGIDINGKETNSGMYDIVINDGKGTRTNILDYFVLSETMRKSYLILAGAGLLLIVVFTAYKIIKQDYFDKTGPRSKGPIFRNVAISCISFFLVIPIFLLIIRVSSLLAVTVMDAMGMNPTQLIGAKIFNLSWSDGGESMRMVNYILVNGGSADVTNARLDWMWDLQKESMFLLQADYKYVKFYDGIDAIVNHKGGGFLTRDDRTIIGDVEFFWYIYLVGVFVAIKALYKLLLAMLQRIFFLMALFVYAPAPISQYVLDDGQKFKDWLAQSIRQGLRLVVAVGSFSIYLMVIDLIGKVDFVSAFTNARANASDVVDNNSINVTTGLLSYNKEVVRTATPMLADGGNSFEKLANAFMRIFVLMGASGAITDLDAILSPLISGAKSSLEAGETGKAANQPVAAAKGAVKELVNLGVGVAGGVMGALAGATIGANKNKKAEKSGAKVGKEQADKENKEAKKNADKPSGSGPAGGKGPTTGGGPAGEGNEAKTPENGNGKEDNAANAPEQSDNEQGVENEGENATNAPEQSENEQGAEKEGENATNASEQNQNGKENSGNSPTADNQSVPDTKNNKFKNVLGVLGKGAAIAGRAVGSAALGGLKAAGRGLKGMAGKLLNKVGINTATFAGAFKEARGIGEGIENAAGKRRYDKSKQNAYNERRQELMHEAESVANQKAGNVQQAAEELSGAIDKEHEAADNLNKATENASIAELNAQEANNEAAEDVKALEPAKPRKGRKETKDKKKEREAFEQARQNIDTYTGKDGKLAKLGITSDMSFEDAKKIVEEKGDDSLKEAFKISNVHQMYDRESVRKARSKNSISSDLQSKIEPAKKAYDDAQKARKAKQANLNNAYGEYNKASAFAAKLSDDIIETPTLKRAETRISYDKKGKPVKETKYVDETNKKKIDKANKKAAKDKNRVDARDTRQQLQDSDKYHKGLVDELNEWASYTEKQPIGNDPNKLWESVRNRINNNNEELTDARNKYHNAQRNKDAADATARISTGNAENFVNTEIQNLEELGKNSPNSASSASMKLELQRRTGMYKDVKKNTDIYTGKDGKLSKLGITSSMSFADAKKIVDEKGDDSLRAAFNLDAAQEVYDTQIMRDARKDNDLAREAAQDVRKAKTALNNHPKNIENKVLRGGLGVIAKYNGKAADYEKRYRAKKEEYEASVTDSVVIQQILDAPEGSKMTMQQRRVVAGVLNSNGESVKPSDITLDHVKQAKDINYKKQVDYVKQGEDVKAKNDANNKEIATILSSMLGKNAPVKEQTQNNVTNINNNTTNINNQNPGSGVGQQSAIGQGVQNGITAKDMAKYVNSPNMYDKMASEGQKYIESMLQKMSSENKEIQQGIDEINKKLDKED